MALMHKHHIIPLHQGGADEPDNLVLLSVKDHAEAHRILYERYGHWEDRIAWLGLSGQLNRLEIIEEMQLAAASRGGLASSGMTGKKHSKKTRLLMSRKLKGRAPTWLGKKHKAETIEQMRKSHIGKHLGKNNSQFGTRWVTNGTESRKISKTEAIPDGWRYGR